MFSAHDGRVYRMRLPGKERLYVVLSAYHGQLAHLRTTDTAGKRTDATPCLLANRQRQTMVMFNSMLDHEKGKKKER